MGERNLGQISAMELLRRAYSLRDEQAARELYRDWAETYDSTMLDGLGYVTPSRTAALLAEHLPEQESAILDVGSGTGLAGVELALRGYNLLDALDYSPEMLAVAGSRNIYRKLIEADLTAPLDIDTAAYDALICTGTFTHAHVGAACLPELFRILKPGGIFACTVHRDVWEEAGFARMVESLESDGTLETLYHQPGTYYTASETPEGFYILWQGKDGSGKETGL